MPHICENIIEAIKYASPEFPIEKIETVKTSMLYECIELSNGKIGAIKTGIFMQPNWFRGEREEYPSILPGIYRGLSKTKQLIANLKAKEFELTLKMFPDIQEQVNENINIDIKALAQHYGFATNLIDITSNILTAAFFATNYCDENYTVVENGIGVIRIFPTSFAYSFKNKFQLHPKIHIEGVQPFRRPAFQDALGYEIDKGEDVSNLFGTIRFKQNKKQNEIIREKFMCNDKCILFPNELISNIADKIRNDSKISNHAVMEYAKEQHLDYNEIVELVKRDIEIVDNPLFNVGEKEIEVYNNEKNWNPYQIYARLIR